MQHLGEGTHRKPGEEPGQHTGIDTGVFTQSDLEVFFRRKSRLIEKIQVYEITGLRAREDAGQFARPKIGEGLDDDAFEGWRRSRDVSNGLVDDIGLYCISMLVLNLCADEVTHVAEESDTDSGLLGNPREETHERPHLFGLMNEEVDISGHPVSEVGTGKRSAATQVAGDAGLASPHEIQDEFRDNTPVERITHDHPGSR